MTPTFVLRLNQLTLLLHAVLSAGLFILLMGDGLGWTLLLALLAVMPLLAALPGLFKRRAYTAGWACMVVVFYCALLLAEAHNQPDRRILLLALALLAALDFVALMLYAKAQKAADKMAIS